MGTGRIRCEIIATRNDSMNLDETTKLILKAVRDDDAAAVQRLIESHPDKLYHDHGTGSWLHTAARHGSIQVAAQLIKCGLDVDAEVDNSTRDTPLFCAVGRDNVAMARVLLESGADPNKGHVLITAVVGSKEHSLELIQLLEEFGADLERVFPYGDDEEVTALSMARDWGKLDVVAYLEQRGPGKRR